MYKLERKIGGKWTEHGTYKSLNRLVKAAFFIGQEGYDDARVEVVDNESNEVHKNGQEQ